MAGTQPGFNGNDFRTAIRFVYEMAAPNVQEEKVYFFKDPRLVYNLGVDNENLPFDPASTVTRTQDAPKTVPCGIELRDSNGVVTDLGIASGAFLVLTLLDKDYAKVKDSDYVTLRGEKYNYSHTVPPTSLFDVSLYEMHFEAASMT